MKYEIDIAGFTAASMVTDVDSPDRAKVMASVCYENRSYLRFDVTKMHDADPKGFEHLMVNMQHRLNHAYERGAEDVRQGLRTLLCVPGLVEGD